MEQVHLGAQDRGGAIAAVLMWTLIGAGAGVAVAGAASIGVFVAPVVALFAWIQIRQRGTEQAGWSAFGAGTFLIGLGVASLPYQACDGSTPTMVVTEVGQTASYQCGGLHPAFPIALGAAMLIGGLVAEYQKRRAS